MYDKPLSKYAVIGDPVSQSMSPAIHNACFQKAGIDATYEAIHISKKELELEIDSLLKKGYKGFNVTIPHKLGIMDLLDDIDPLAEVIGAVNTVAVEGNKLKGYNTDGPGFHRALLEFYKGDLRKAEILVIGAGGAARAIIKTLLMNEVRQISVSNRTIEKAKRMLDGNGYALTPKEAEETLNRYDLIINTTPIGMSPLINETPLSTNKLESHTGVIDIIYNPLTTKLLKEGSVKRCSVQNGVPMFIHQAALSFEIWTGKKPDLSLMKSIVENELGGK